MNPSRHVENSALTEDHLLPAPDAVEQAPGPLDAAAGSAFAWDSMSNGAKLLLLTYAMLAVVARTWTETWKQADWPHELSL